MTLVYKQPTRSSRRTDVICAVVRALFNGGNLTVTVHAFEVTCNINESYKIMLIVAHHTRRSYRLHFCRQGREIAKHFLDQLQSRYKLIQIPPYFPNYHGPVKSPSARVNGCSINEQRYSLSEIANIRPLFLLKEYKAI